MPVYHVRPIPQGGGWYVAREDSPFAHQMFRQRQDAIWEARKLRGRERGEVRVYSFECRLKFMATPDEFIEGGDR